MEEKSPKLKTLSAIMCLALLAGCGGGGSGSSDPGTPSDPASTVELREIGDSSTVYQAGSMVTSSAPVELSENSLEMTFQIPEARYVDPNTQFGSVSIVSDGTLRYTFNPAYLDTYESQFSESISLNNTKSAPVTYIGKKVTEKEDQIHYIDKNGVYRSVSIPFFSDPLFWAQWHIKNNGKSVQLPYGNVYGEGSDKYIVGTDLNILPVWAQGFTGKGVTVAVIDEDMEIAHEDLAANVNVELCYNGIDDSHDPTFDPSDPDLADHSHGTSISGIIAAVKNDVGVRGVAYDAKLAGYNYMNNKVTETENFFLEKILNSDIQVINESYGPINGLYIANYENILLYHLASKKAVVVKSMGNEYNKVTYPSSVSKPDGECTNPYYSTGNVDCGVYFGTGYYTSPYVITAGALGANGDHAPYGSTGSNLLLSAFGGSSSPYIITTDRTGCSLGYSQSSADNSETLYDHCKYNSRMNGTSSAAPEISGAVALIKSANPDLSTLQTKYVLIKSAHHKFPAMEADERVQTKLGTSSIINHQGWVTNDAGYAFNNKYGFGVPDVAKAVDYALHCNEDPECLRRADVDDLVKATIDIQTGCSETSMNGYYQYDCYFIGPLKDDKGNSHTKMRIEDVAVTVNQLYFKANGECDKDFNASYGNTKCAFNALSKFQLQLLAPASAPSSNPLTTSILKHINSYTVSIRSGADMLTHAFYQQDVNGATSWKVQIFSANKIIIDNSSDNTLKLSLKVYGYDL